MTAADQLRAEGRVEALRDVLLEQLEVKFGSVAPDMRVRIERAKKLLAESAQKLETIAQMCGYRSANSFWFAFKQATGLSPKEYRLKAAR